jgi:peptide-methionine (R)-S-oxide reductase
MRTLALLFFSLLISISSSAQTPKPKNSKKKAPAKITLTDAEWKARMAPIQFHVMREKGTEEAFTGEWWDNHEKGYYICSGCGARLFDSKAKFDYGTGWPTFSSPSANSEIEETIDDRLGIMRREVHCGRCGGHLGHVFEDGPAPTGLRYCVNSCSLLFRKQ